MQIINLACRHSGKDRTAGSKAQLDAQEIVSRIQNVRTIWSSAFSSWTGFVSKWIGRILRAIEGVITLLRIPRGAIVFIQFPGVLVSGRLWKIFVKPLIRVWHARTIVLVHDINSIRYGRDLDNREKEEYNSLAYLLKTSSVVISHNEIMSGLIETHFSLPKSRIVDLGIFDYLGDFSLQRDPSVNERSVVIAGNLMAAKAGYVKRLKEIKGCEWHLFGPNLDVEAACAPNVVYHGSFAAEKLPLEVSAFGFGLVWDGDSVETCSGGYGEYLKVNNPHKLSLYLASGLPVIIWGKSAMSRFVKDNRIGFCVESLFEVEDVLSKITHDQYDEFRCNAVRVGEGIRTGHFLSAAVTQALDMISQIEA